MSPPENPATAPRLDGVTVAPTPPPPAPVRTAPSVLALLLGTLTLLALLGAAGAGWQLLEEQRQRQDQLRADVAALRPRLDALGKRLDALAQAGPVKADPRQAPREERPFYAFRRLAVLPMPPLEEATDSLKAALTQLEQSLPVLLRKHTELEMVPPEEVARVKAADPVQAGRQLKADAVLVVRPRWDPHKRDDGTVVLQHQTRGKRRGKSVRVGAPRWYKNKRPAPQPSRADGRQTRAGSVRSSYFRTAR